jgi:hypothetical protein
MQPQGGRKFVRLVKIEGLDYRPDVLPQLLPGITFGHDCLGQTLSAIAAVGFLDHFEDEFSHVHKSKLPMAERQVAAISNGPDPMELEFLKMRETGEMLILIELTNFSFDNPFK